jgi:Xaa-Pro dipeptidase
MTSTNSIYSIRQKQLQLRMQTLQIHGFLMNYYIDIFYYTGSMQTGYLFIPSHGESIFFVRRSVERAQEESYFTVEALPSIKQLQDKLNIRYPELFEVQPTFATEFDVLPVAGYHKLVSSLPDVKWLDGSQLVREQRMIKSDCEVESIRKAAHIVNEVLELVPSYVKVGMAEFELLAFIEFELRKRSHLGVMRMRTYNSEIFTGIVAAGASAAVPTYFDGPAGGRGLHPAHPQGSSQAPIRLGDPLLIDIGCCIEGYLIDQTRTFVIGELAPQLYDAYQISEEIIRTTETMLKPGAICEELYEFAIGYVERSGLKDHFMGYGDHQVKFLGHGIGLEIDEFPILAKGHRYPLQAGMVIAIEPKFIFPEVGVVGIENTYLITENGFEKLTISREGLTQL